MIKLGFAKFDSAVYITTKSYQSRTAEERDIATTMLLNRMLHIWYTKDNQKFTGEFRDYYLSGKIKASGHMVDGRYDGLIKGYYRSGILQMAGNYSKGLKEGSFEIYHLNGAIKNKTNYKRDRASGLSQEFYSTGKLSAELFYKEQVGIEWNAEFPSTSQKHKEVSSLLTEAMNQMMLNRPMEAVGLLNHAQTLDPECARIYFDRAMAWHLWKNIDSAMLDFERALALEPLYRDVFVNRALVRIQKYDKTLKFNKGIFNFIGARVAVIPELELEAIRNDLNSAEAIDDELRGAVTVAIAKYARTQ